MASSALPRGSLVLLWAGEDTVLHAALLEALQAANIPFRDQPAGAEACAPRVDVFRLEGRSRFGFEVSVLSSRMSEAEGILEGLLDEEPVDMGLPAEDAAAAPATSTPNAGRLSPATSAVWSGAEVSQADFLSQALRENEIPVRVEKRANVATIYVPPGVETLAREIIREILEGAPPA
jgi:hypothetical protein